MLGFTSIRKPVTGKIAREIHEQLNRISTGNLSDEDKEMKAKQNSKTQYVLIEK